MKKKNVYFKKIITILICISFVASIFVMTSCTEENASISGNSTSNTENSSISDHSGSTYNSSTEYNGEYLNGAVGFSDNLLVANTQHDIIYSQTNNTVYSNGKSDYVIVTPAEASSTVEIAKGELISLFREATGYTISSEVDTELTYSSTKKYISLGNTTIAKQAGVSTQGLALKTQGYIMRTVGQSIFIMGEERGVLMGVYKLLNIWFDFDQMNNTYYNLNKNVQSVPLYSFNITDVPDIDYRMAAYGGACNNATVNRRMGTMYNDVFIDGAGVHSILKTIVPYEEYRESHPKWFLSVSQDSCEQTQLCYTAHGNADEYAAMVDCAVEHLKTLIIKDPNHNLATITQMDVNIWCTCDSCSALKTKYGTDAVSQIKFTNDVVAKLKTWLRDEMNGREVEFVIFAYHKTVKAPSFKNTEGKWVPIDDEALMKDVTIWLAPINGNFIDSVFSPENTDMYETCESWLPIADRFLFWGYDTHFNNYMVPLDSYSSMQDMIKECVRCKTSLFWAQGSYNLHNSTSFDNVKAYLYSKLMWDCTLNVNDIIHNYFVKTYRAASGTMEQAFWNMRTRLLEQNELGVEDSIYGNNLTVSSWPSRYLFGQLNLFEKAKSELVVYSESDPEFYSTAIDQVRLESISPRYMIISLYPSAFSEYEFDDFLDQFAADVRELDVNMVSEGGSMELFLARYSK